MPASIFSGDGLADSPVCNRSRTTILGCALMRYRRLGARAETSAARSTWGLRAARHSPFSRSLVLARLGNRCPALRVQGQANPALERIAIVVGRDTLTLAVG